jgi:nitrite reductase (NADH) large subunit
MAVSGCIRECAEAQSKDVGLIATEQGYNLYVCGNGGSKPRHADLLASDLDEELALKYIDRFLAYYIMTAERLTRTSVWLEKLEGGIDHVCDVVIHDKLGIAAELEAMTQYLVDTYECEWAAVIRDPEKRRRFRQFVNSDESEPCIEFVSERGQSHPVDWPSDFVSLEQFRMHDGRALGELTYSELRWVPVGHADDFPIDGGATVKYGRSQIAVFNFASRGEWYATQNMCPHKRAFVLSRGIVGTMADEPKIACPLHKKTFSLKSGDSLQGEEYRIKTFRAKVESGRVYVELPPPESLESVMADEVPCAVASCCNELASEAATCGVTGL